MYAPRRYSELEAQGAQDIYNPHHLEYWLRQRGLGRFADRLRDFGVDTLHDLHDSDIISDVELRSEIGMNDVEIRKFRKACQTNRTVDWSHLNKKATEAVRRKTQLIEKQEHEGYAEYVLFIRKMKRSMHFKRIDKLGKLHNCSMRFTKQNTGLTFTRGGRKVDLHFDAMRGVHEMVNPEGMPNAGRLIHVNLEKLLPVLGLGVAKRSFMMTFSYKDDTTEEEMKAEEKRQLLAEKRKAKEEKKAGGVGAALAGMFGGGGGAASATVPHDKRRSAFTAGEAQLGGSRPSAKRATGLGGLNFAALVLQAHKVDKANRMLIEVAHRDAPNGVADFSMESAAVSNVGYKHLSDGCTAAEFADGKGEGCVVLVMVCANTSDMRVAVRGMRTGMKHYHRHSTTVQELYKKGGLLAQKKPKWLRKLDYFHHLYRAHYHHQHPPPRFHNGIVVEVAFDESYNIDMDFHGRSKGMQTTTLPMPCPVFQPGMYLRAKIIDYKWDTESYDLLYLDGPYMGDEQPDGQQHFEAPPDHPKVEIFVRGVSSAHIIVDLFDNYGSHLPIFLVGITLFQILRFFSHCWFVEPGVAITSSSPIAGPENTWMKVVSEFPDCEDLRHEWWRLLTYQTVHAGYEHLFFNVIMQILFGMPINLVHGNLRFAFIYEVGVLGGALAFATIGGGGGALVGCSGGVYCVIGMMVAEIIINWDVSSKGLMNHWTRLAIISIVLIMDFYLYYAARSDSTSYSAHAGGFAVGLIVGILCLDNLELSKFEQYFLLPVTHVAVVVLAIGSVYTYLFVYPPGKGILGMKNPTCCQQMFACEDIEPDEYDCFLCYAARDVRGGAQWRDTCERQTDWIIKERANGHSLMEDCGRRDV